MLVANETTEGNVRKEETERSVYFMYNMLHVIIYNSHFTRTNITFSILFFKDKSLLTKYSFAIFFMLTSSFADIVEFLKIHTNSIWFIDKFIEMVEQFWNFFLYCCHQYCSQTHVLLCPIFFCLIYRHWKSTSWTVMTCIQPLVYTFSMKHMQTWHL